MHSHKCSFKKQRSFLWGGGGSSCTFYSRALDTYQIKSKLLVLGAVKTTINDKGCQHVTGRFESIRKLLNKPAGWPKFVQSHLTVETVE